MLNLSIKLAFRVLHFFHQTGTAMKTVLSLLALLLCATTISTNLAAQQTPEFDLDAYKQFLEEHQVLSYDGLLDLYPFDELLGESPIRFSDALYADTVQRFYRLNKEEIALLERHSFMVTDRIRYQSFGEAFFTIYKRDLPVYLSSDAILHALHMSYSEILQNLEHRELKPRLEQLLTGLHRQLPELDERYGDGRMMIRSLRDIDLYLTIPRILLGQQATPYFPGNEAKVEELMKLIDGLTMSEYPLFAHVPRTIDFSQFTPRGHYTSSEALTRYFQAMMWLGRTEFYLILPKSSEYNNLSEEERNQISQRQTINAYLIHEALAERELTRNLRQMDRIITFLSGESDNVTPDHLDQLQRRASFDDASALTDMDVYLTFRRYLEQAPYASQRILSQILVTDPTTPDKVEPASAFLLLGQRFIIDSYVMGNVVYDKVANPHRMLPKGADVLFALGNNDALELLKSELEYYGYQRQLAALRYLIDSYDHTYWQTSFFNLWLNVIRQLNPRQERKSLTDDTSDRFDKSRRSELPEFMQTEAWSRKTMTTQLASWAQLRHDNLLYGKQSYTVGPVCEYPQTYVEPVPHFFRAMKLLAMVAGEEFGELLGDGWMRNRILHYFRTLEEIMDKLGPIAQKQLDGIDTSPDEKAFLKEMLHETDVCGVQITGWYKDLYFTGEDGALEKDYVVADVHTSPYDQSGSQIGWVYHVGTGPLNLAVLTARLGDGNTYAFVGPVMSYYEHVSVNFKRLTDEEWVAMFEDEPALRPEFVESYLFDSGEFYYDNRNHVVSADQEDRAGLSQSPGQIVLQQNYPNPFNSGTTITFRIPAELGNGPVKLAVYDLQGRLVQTLVDEHMPAGNYTVRWEANAASGTYYYRLEVAGQARTGQMTLVK